MIKKPRVGIVGEILVKFLPAANNHLAELLEAEGAEAVVPGPDRLSAIYCFYNQNFKVEHLGLQEVKQPLLEPGVSRQSNGSVSTANEAFEQSRTLCTTCQH